MNERGVRVQWTRQREETLQAFLTFDRARELFGLGGTPDDRVAKRVSQTASRDEIIAAATADGPPERLQLTAGSIVRFDQREWDLPAPPDPEPTRMLPPWEPMHLVDWTGTDIAAMRAALRHAADHLDEVRDDIAGPYHAGDQAPAEVISQLIPTLNTLAEYVREVRAALIVMAGGGLRDDGKGDWMVGAAGPYNEMADALAARTINEINEFVIQGPED